MTTTNDGGQDNTKAGPVLPDWRTFMAEPPLAIAGDLDQRWVAIQYGRQCWNACDEQVAGPLREQLAECFNLGGADADGNGTEWRALHAIRSVRQLRQDYDETCDEAERLRERIAELEDCLRKSIGIADRLRETRDDLKAELDRLRAENEALAALLTECSDDLESEVEARRGGDVPRRIERDLEPVRKARELLAARAAREGKCLSRTPDAPRPDNGCPDQRCGWMGECLRATPRTDAGGEG